MEALISRSERKKERKKDHSEVASILSWSKSICNPGMGITRTRGPFHPFEGEHFEA
jgi:hypothetical protein